MDHWFRAGSNARSVASTIGSSGQVDHIIVDVAETAEDSLCRARALEFHPFVVSGQSFLQTSMPDAPATDDEIKVTAAGCAV
jgi:hypothetical protein